MKVSVAMATWNGERYLLDQLHSLVRQRRQPDEVIVTDDRSSDATLEILRSFAGSVPFRMDVRLNRERLGCAANFDKALSLCRGDVVLLSDQDDVWFPGKLAAVEATFKENPDVSVLINDARITDEDLVPSGRTRMQQARSGGYPLQHFVQGSCTSVRRKLLTAMLPIPSCIWSHDSWIHAIAHLLGVRLMLDAPLQDFRRHRCNHSSSPTSRWSKVTRMGSIADRVQTNLNDSERREDALSREVQMLQQLSWWWEVNRARVPSCAGSMAFQRGSENAALLGDRLRVAKTRRELAALPRHARALSVGALYAREGDSYYGGKGEVAKDLLLR